MNTIYYYNKCFPQNSNLWYNNGLLVHVIKTTAGQIFLIAVLFILWYISWSIWQDIYPWLYMFDTFVRTCCQRNIYIDDRKNNLLKQTNYCIVDLFTGEQHDNFIICFYNDQDVFAKNAVLSTSWYCSILRYIYCRPGSLSSFPVPK